MVFNSQVNRIIPSWSHVESESGDSWFDGNLRVPGSLGCKHVASDSELPHFQFSWFGSIILYCSAKSLCGLRRFRRLSVSSQMFLIGTCSKVRLKYCRLDGGWATSSPFADVTSSRHEMHEMHMHFRQYFLTYENVCTRSGAFRTRIRRLQGSGLTKQGTLKVFFRQTNVEVQGGC